MKPTVCISARTVGYPEGGGHLWVYLNWALGLAANGYRVFWLETMAVDQPEPARQRILGLQERLRPYGLSDDLVIGAYRGVLPSSLRDLSFDAVDPSDVDLLVNLNVRTDNAFVERFRRTALVDIDPGLTQSWLSLGTLDLPRHDVYVTTGETVGKVGARFPDGGLEWRYVPPCVSLEHWPVTTAGALNAYTTVSHWQMGEWMQDGDEVYPNNKRDGFLPFLDLPQRTSADLELALALSPSDERDESLLDKKGWRVRAASTVASTPWDYQRYVQGSRGEFSCAKPSCIRMQNAWISDRTLCYLASGKPAVVQHTGPSRILPDEDGLLRFRTLEEAARAISRVEKDYERHCRSARALVERHFDAQRVAARLLEVTLP